MNLLVVEYANAGGEGGKPYLNEGGLMLTALLRDLYGMENANISTILGDTDTADRFPAHLHFDLEGDFWQTFEKVLRTVDGVWPIAPETGGILQKISLMVRDKGKALIGSSPVAVAETGDKLICYHKLSKYLAMPKTAPLKKRPDAFPCVIKPRFGAGSEGVRLHRNDTGLGFGPGFIQQPAVEGEHFSAGVISGPGGLELLGVCRQQVSEDDDQLACRGVEGPIDFPHNEAVQKTARLILNAIPGLAGYWGFDFVHDGRTLTLIEINPRLTTSYPLYSAARQDNLAEDAIGFCLGAKGAY